MESARAAGVRRIVLASSGEVNWWRQLRGPFPIRPEDPTSPRSWYAATKMFMEAIDAGFAETENISIIVARLGWCPRTLGHQPRSPRRIGRKTSTLAPATLAVSSPARSRHPRKCATRSSTSPAAPSREPGSTMSAAKLLGYEPQEIWPQGTELIAG